MVQQTAQPVPEPQLHRRTDDDDAASEAKKDKGVHHASTLPRDVSGPYAFDRDGESIEIDIDRGKLGGYISRLGDADTDANTPLTFFFEDGWVDSSQIHFQSKVVHGVWYSFVGTIRRGTAQARDDEGYYVLEGSLGEHHPRNGRDKSANETVEQRMVSYKSLGQ